MEGFWVKDQNISSQFFVMLLSTSPTQLSGTKRTFLDHCKHSRECLRLPSFHVPVAGSAATAINICLPLTLSLVLVIFGAKVPESHLSLSVLAHAAHGVSKLLQISYRAPIPISQLGKHYGLFLCQWSSIEM